MRMKLKEFRTMINDPKYDEELEVCTLDDGKWAMRIKDMQSIDQLNILLLFAPIGKNNQPICKWAVHLNGITETEKNGL